MPTSVENIYSSALFELFEDKYKNDKRGFESALSELRVINDALICAPELVKLSLVPTISRDEKLKVIKNVFGGKSFKASPYVLNFL